MTILNIEYIIVQAGGKGTRLKELTQNKPKALVSVKNKPMIFHLFNQFPQSKFIIIGDYKADVFEKYLDCFSNVEYVFINTENKGTCAGINEALTHIPSEKQFMLIWSDLIPSETFRLEDIDTDSNYVGIAKEFICRWSYQKSTFIEEKSSEQGVAGLFIFTNKKRIEDVPISGEFVRWLSHQRFHFNELPLYGFSEIGLIEEYIKVENSEQRCRPFNKIVIKENLISKIPQDDQGKRLAQREQNWYQYLEKYGFKDIPKIISFDPITMKLIDGEMVFKKTLLQDEKADVLNKIMDSLDKLHAYENIQASKEDIIEAYFTKTIDRIKSVQKLIPFATEEYITINDKKCRNIFFNIERFREKVEELIETEFCIIHGDCTFSNIILDSSDHLILIDPRGYFGFSEIYGDVNYDWAKLYYSIKGNYDQFNNKNFNLEIRAHEVKLRIESNEWEEMEKDFFAFIGEPKREKIAFIHAIIWLSLTTYAWEDYDSICGAFYNGIYLLEDCL